MAEITIVAGPPCSGKTTYVRDHVRPGDEVLDWDEVFAELAGRAVHDRDLPNRVELELATEREFRRRMDAMRRGWIIRLAPRRQHRAIMRRVKGARSVVLATAPEVCLARLEQDDSRTDKQADAAAIARWWLDYDGPSSSADEVTVRASL